MKRIIENMVSVNDEQVNKTKFPASKLGFSNDEKIEVLTEFASWNNGTIEGIKRADTFIYRGVKCPIGIWIRCFREAKKGKGSNSALTPSQEKALEKLGMVWDVTGEYLFDRRIKILEAYAQEHGSIAKIKGQETYLYKGETYCVGSYITIIRAAKKGKGEIGTLTDEQIAKLESLGMIWEIGSSVINERHDFKIEVLTAYASEFGSIAKIKQNEKYEYNGNTYTIGMWIARFREAINGKGPYAKPTVEQIKKLDKLGMMWSIHETQFNKKMEIFRAYAKENGTIANILLSDKYTYNDIEYPVGSWIAGLRRALKDGEYYKPTQEEMEELNSLGMIWDKFEDSYISKITVLKHYAKQHGSIAGIKRAEWYECNGEEYPVGIWIDRFRQLKKGTKTDGTFTEVQVKELESLGMAWDALTERFNKKLRVLQAYFNEHGTISQLRETDKYEYEGEIYPIGKWIQRFRQALKGTSTCAKPNEEQIAQLNALGMIWNGVHTRGRKPVNHGNASSQDSGLKR